MEFDNLDDLRVLLATAETGSLTGAGRRCGLSTAAVSAAVKRLEAALGVRLFERTTRSVRPTAEGEVMIDHARRALELVSEGQAKVRAGSAGLSGTIRITAAAVFAHEMLAAWLAEFAAQHPQLEVDLLVSDAVLDLVRDGIDLALRNGPLADSSHSARLLAPARRVVCASPEYVARRGAPARLRTCRNTSAWSTTCGAAAWACGSSTVKARRCSKCASAGGWVATTRRSRSSGRCRAEASSTNPSWPWWIRWRAASWCA
jgi:DNA-binding transcriptional LysR family regulator